MFDDIIKVPPFRLNKADDIYILANGMNYRYISNVANHRWQYKLKIYRYAVQYIFL